jgi:hypothetical protein
MNTFVTPIRVNSLATTNAQLLVANASGPGGEPKAVFLTEYDMSNTSGTVAFVKLYDTSTVPTAGAGTPVKVLGIPPNQSRAQAFDSNCLELFKTGIGMTITGGPADNDTTAVGLNQVIVNIGWK